MMSGDWMSGVYLGAIVIFHERRKYSSRFYGEGKNSHFQKGSSSIVSFLKAFSPTSVNELTTSRSTQLLEGLLECVSKAICDLVSSDPSL